MSIVLTQIPQCVFISTNIKTNVNAAKIAVDSIKSINVGAYVGTDGLFATDALRNYRQQLEGLTVTQQKMALMSTNLTEAQRSQVLQYISATAATKTLTAEQVLSCTADEKQILVKAGLITEEELEKGSTIDLTKEKLKELLANEALSVSDKNTILNKFGVTAANLTEATSWEVLGKSIGKAVLAKLKWLALTPEGWLTLAIGAVVVGIAAYVKWGNTLANTREKLNDLKSECVTITSDIESVNSELETTKQRLDELKGKDTLTFTEKEEYDNLVKQNNELNRQLDLLKLLYKEKSKEGNKLFVQAMEKELDDDLAYHTTPTDFDENGEVVETRVEPGVANNEYHEKATKRQYIEQQINDYQENLDRIAHLDGLYRHNLNDKGYKEKRKKLEKENEEILKYLQDEQSKFATTSEGIEYIDNPKNEDEVKVNEWLDFINDFQDRMAIAMGGDNAKQNAFNRVVDNWQFDDTVQGLQDLGKEGKVTAEMLDDPKYDAFIKKLVELDVIDSEDNLGDIALAFNNVATASDSAASTVNGVTLSLSSLEKVSDNIGKLSSAYKELNDNGYITIKTLNELKTATGLSGDEWAAYETKLLNAKKGSGEFSQVMSDLTYKIIENQLSTVDLANATDEEVAAIENKIAASLRENGVTNVSAVAHASVAEVQAHDSPFLRAKSALRPNNLKALLKFLVSHTGLFHILNKVFLYTEVNDKKRNKEYDYSRLLNSVKRKGRCRRSVKPCLYRRYNRIGLCLRKLLRKTYCRKRSVGIEVTGVVCIAVIPYKRQDKHCHNCRCGIGESNFEICFVESTAVDKCRFFQLLGQAQEELTEHIDKHALLKTKAEKGKQIQCNGFVDKIHRVARKQLKQSQNIKVFKSQILRNKQRLVGNTEGYNNQREYNRTAGDFNSAQNVTCHRADKHLNYSDARRIKQRKEHNGEIAVNKTYSGFKAHNGPSFGYPYNIGITHILNIVEHRRYKLD